MEHGENGTWKLTAGESTLEISTAPLRFRLLHRGAPVAGSITDEHFRGFTRLPAFGRVREGAHWTAALALVSGEPVYGLGEKFGPLNKRGQLVHSHVADALGVNTGLAYKNVPFAWGPGSGKGAWGFFVHTTASVTHGVGHPDWSHRSYAIYLEDEALDIFVFAADTPAGILDFYTQLTGRPATVPLWSLGLWVSRAYYKTPEEATAVAAKLRAHRIPCDVLTLDGRAAWKVETRVDFEWDPDRFPNPRAALAAIREHNLRICVWEYPYVSVHSPLFTDLASRGYLLTTADGDPYVFGWDTAPGTSPFGKVLTPLPESGIVDFTQSRRLCLVARCARSALRRRRRCDQERFRRAGSRRRGCIQRRQAAVGCTTCIRSSTTSCVFEATARVRARPRVRAVMVWDAPGGPAASAIPIQWVAIRKATGKGSPRRSAAR